MAYKTTDIAAKLSTAFVINSARFAVATPTKQTEILAQAGGLPVIFVSSFNDFSNRKKIRDGLLSGVDVSLNLEFIGVTLTEEEARVFSLVQPILEKLGKPSGVWLEGTEKLPRGIEIANGLVKRNGYYISTSVFESLWRKASRYWYNLDNAEDGKRVRKPDSDYVSTSNHSRYTTFGRDKIDISCQSISRLEVEAVARHLELEWNIPS